jgi:phosphopantothenoylcysteine synthetase/decarboxylase
MIDRVRDWGNIFTGNTGFSIAKALSSLGQVDLVSSNAAHRDEARSLGMGAVDFRSHLDLLNVLRDQLARHAYDAIFMTAAVADYVPTGSFVVLDRKPLPDGSEQWIVRNVSAGKVKSTHEAIAVLGAQTKKIVDCFRNEWSYKGLLIKFKLEVGLTHEELIAVGQKSRAASGADYLVANTLDMVSGDNGTNAGAGAYLLSDTGAEWVPRGSLAERCRSLVAASLTMR